MASTTSTASLSSPSTTVIDSKAPRPQAASPHCVTLPPPPVAPQNRSTWKTTAYCRRIARNVISMATRESQIMAAAVDAPTAVEGGTELSEILKTVQQAGSFWVCTPNEWSGWDTSVMVGPDSINGTKKLWYHRLYVISFQYKKV